MKCGGCTNTIINRLINLTGVFFVEIEIESAATKVDHNQSFSKLTIITHLQSLRYPELDTNNTVLHKAKSFMSCAVGRLIEEA